MSDYPDPYRRGFLHGLWMSTRPLIARHRRNPVFRGVTRI